MPSPSDIGQKNVLNFSAIKNLLLSETSGFYDLHKKFEAIASSNRKNGFLFTIADRESKLKEVTKNLKIFDIQNSRKDKLITEQRSVQKEIDQMQHDLDGLETRKNTLMDIRKNLKKIDTLNEELNRIREEVDAEHEKISTIARMKQELNEKFPEFDGLEIENGDALDRLQEIFIEVRNTNEKIDAFFARNSAKKKLTRKAALTIATIVVTVVAALAYTRAITPSDSLQAIAGAIAISATLCVALMAYPYIATGSKTLEVLKENKRIMGHKMKEYADKIRIHQSRYTHGERYEFLLQYFEDYIEYSDKNRELMELNQSLKDTRHLAAIRTKLNTLKAEEEKIKGMIASAAASLNIDRLAEPDYITLEELIDETEARIASVTDSIVSKESILQKIDEEIRQNPDNAAGTDGLLEEKKEIEAALDGLYGKKNAMDYASSLLARTIERSEARQLKKLVSLGYERFNLLTENQFISQITEEQLRQLLIGEQSAEGLNPNMVHFIMLSIKLSLSDFLADAGISLPLMIDDPFLFMDEEKIKKFRELVLDIADKRQVIIFTHKKDSTDWGNHLEL
jgi:DNA repair exonuclease SbcCD ATPase subunit